MASREKYEFDITTRPIIERAQRRFFGSPLLIHFAQFNKKNSNEKQSTRQSFFMRAGI